MAIHDRGNAAGNAERRLPVALDVLIGVPGAMTACGKPLPDVPRRIPGLFGGFSAVGSAADALLRHSAEVYYLENKSWTSYAIATFPSFACSSLGIMRTHFHVPTFLPTNRAAWSVVTLLLFSLFWDWLDLSRDFFEGRAGGSVIEGVRVVGPISLSLFGMACVVAWGIQGVGVVAFRHWAYPWLERRYGAGVTLSYILSPRRWWASYWFRRGVFASVAFMAVLLGLCAFFRVWHLRDFEAYRGMAAECPPVWHAFAFRQFARGDSTAALFAKFPPTRKEEFGRYGIYHYGLGFTGFEVIARDGRLLTAGAGSCTWGFTFFETPDSQLDSDYQAYMQSNRREERPER